MIFTKELRIFDRMILLKFQSMKIPIEPTSGISARVPFTTEFTIFLDYDNVEDERLKEELMYLQEVYRLGDFYIFATNQFGRHAICIDRLPLREALEVVYNSTCDPTFQRGIRINEYRTWILRAIEKGNRTKPRYVYAVESPYNGERLQSNAHAQFLMTHCGAPIRLVNPDDNYELEVQGYKTSSKITLKEQK
jgi:hypothetical protein